MKTFLILYLVSHVRVFVADGDLSHLNGHSLTTSAQATAAHERAQDELFNRFHKFDDATNMNVPALRELGLYEGLPEGAHGEYKVIRIKP